MVLRRDYYDIRLDGLCHRHREPSRVRPDQLAAVRSWSYSGGDYAIAVPSDRFVIAERAKVASLDELSRRLNAERS